MRFENEILSISFDVFTTFIILLQNDEFIFLLDIFRIVVVYGKSLELGKDVTVELLKSIIFSPKNHLSTNQTTAKCESTKNKKKK